MPKILLFSVLPEFEFATSKLAWEKSLAVVKFETVLAPDSNFHETIPVALLDKRLASVLEFSG